MCCDIRNWGNVACSVINVPFIRHHHSCFYRRGDKIQFYMQVYEWTWCRETTSPSEWRKSKLFKPVETGTNLVLRITSKALLYLAYCTERSLIYLCKFPASGLELNLSYCGTENITLIAVAVQLDFSWHMSIKTLNAALLVVSFTVIGRCKAWCKHYS